MHGHMTVKCISSSHPILSSTVTPRYNPTFFFYRSVWVIYGGRRQIYALHNAELVFPYIRGRWLRVSLYWVPVILLNDLSHTRSIVINTDTGNYGSRLVQLVEALRYKPEGREFDSWWGNSIFHWLNPSGRTMTLGSTQPLTEMSTRNNSWGGINTAGA